MAWPVVAILLLAALGGCWVACAAAQAGHAQASWPLTVAAAAVLCSLFGEVAALNGSAAGGSVDGVGVVSLFGGGIALAAFAYYLLTPPPVEPDSDPTRRRTGPAANPDSEA